MYQIVPISTKQLYRLMYQMVPISTNDCTACRTAPPVPQGEALRPFASILRHSDSAAVRELAVACVAHAVRAQVQRLLLRRSAQLVLFCFVLYWSGGRGLHAATPGALQAAPPAPACCEGRSTCYVYNFLSMNWEQLVYVCTGAFSQQQQQQRRRG